MKPIPLVLYAVAAVILALAGCNGSSGIPNLTQSAAPLAGNDVYVGPRMSIPRYGHTATLLEDNTVLIIGGTDEEFFTGLEEVEIFDQSASVDLTAQLPESITGAFLDQDIDGDLITMSQGGRFFHTADAIEDGNVLVIGGTTSVLFGIANEVSEIYDPLTRSFSNPDFQIDQDDDVQIPRVHHATSRLPNGKLLLSGGQETVTVLIPGGGPFGGTLAQAANPTTDVVEVFDPATLSFEVATDNNGDIAELTTPRGRALHKSVALSGFDNLLGTGDDVVLITGGMQTLSAFSLQAPEDLLPWAGDALTSLDFYFSSTGAIGFGQGIVLPKRSNGFSAINLGQNRQATPFGSFGVSNVVLLVGGDNHTLGCPEGPSDGELAADLADLIVASYTGFGPANGVRFALFSDATAANGFELGPPCNNFLFNRSEADAVLLDMIRTIDGQPRTTSVLVTAGGSDQTDTPGGCVVLFNNTCGNIVDGFEFYDPYYDLIGVMDLDGDGVLGDGDIFPWMFEDNGTPFNPLGIRGTFLAYDADVVTGQDLTGLGDATPTAALSQGRSFHTLTRIPGENGLIGDIDDRVVVIGGSTSYWPIYGDEIVTTSCEIFVPPDAGVVAP